MESNYGKIVQQNLDRLFSDLPPDLAERLPGIRRQDGFCFPAFGRECRIQKNGILLDGQTQANALGILLSLYALNAKPDPCRLEPVKSYKDFPNSMPYQAAFTTHTERPLVPRVRELKAAKDRIAARLGGGPSAGTAGGDFSFWVHPLPKVALIYIFYEADEDFPASVTCLFSNNADAFMPLDGLADVGEYTSKAMLDMITAPAATPA